MHLYAHRILATPVNISLPENFYARSTHEVCLFLVIQKWANDVYIEQADKIYNILVYAGGGRNFSLVGSATLVEAALIDWDGQRSSFKGHRGLVV